MVNKGRRPYSSLPESWRALVWFRRKAALSFRIAFGIPRHYYQENINTLFIGDTERFWRRQQYVELPRHPTILCICELIRSRQIQSVFDLPVVENLRVESSAARKCTVARHSITKLVDSG
jgi:hypothetical protein